MYIFFPTLFPRNVGCFRPEKYQKLETKDIQSTQAIDNGHAVMSDKVSAGSESSGQLKKDVFLSLRQIPFFVLVRNNGPG